MRAEIEPGAIREILSEAFILAHTKPQPIPSALPESGSARCHELKGQSFLRLWDEASRPAIRDLFSVLTDEWVGTVAGVTASNASGEPVELELLLLPLSATRPNLARTIGVPALLTIPP